MTGNIPPLTISVKSVDTRSESGWDQNISASDISSFVADFDDKWRGTLTTNHNLNLRNLGSITALMELEEFAVAFTIAVTEASDPTVDLVAKNGKHSIYSVFQEIFPQARASLFFQ